MKKWIQKLMDQLDLDIHIESDNYPSRKTREVLDQFTKGLIQNSNEELGQVLFRFRQFYSKYRIEECAYIEKTFEDFKSIVWEKSIYIGKIF